MVLQHITNKQKEIILLLYRFRFLNRIQIQTLLHNKDHKNINNWLKDLTTKNYIARTYDKTHQKNTTPGIFFVSANGFKYLKFQDGVDLILLKKFRQEKRRSERFIEKSILVADIYLKLLSEESLKNRDFKFYSQQDFPGKGLIRELHPDFAYVYRVDKELEHFVGEVFSDKMPRYLIKSRVNKFMEYFGDDDGKPTNIIFICKDEFILSLVRKYIYRIIRDEGEANANFYTATTNEIHEKGMAVMNKSSVII